MAVAIRPPSVSPAGIQARALTSSPAQPGAAAIRNVLESVLLTRQWWQPALPVVYGGPMLVSGSLLEYWSETY